MKSLSSGLQEDINSTSGTAPLLLLEIHHPDLPVPIRVVQDNQDLVHDGELFQAFAFDAQLPDDIESQNPEAQLVIDNVGREISAWLEASGGGQGATVRMIIVRRVDPDVVEWEVTLDLTNTRMNQSVITGKLGFDNLMSRPACAIHYNPTTASGMF